jgi:hypothetical protein
MKTHNEQYEALQTEYLKTRDNKVLGKMYLIAKEAAKNYISKYCRARGLKLNIDELSHDSAIYIIEQYLRKPEFKIEKISSYIYFGTRKSLFRDKEQEQCEISWDELNENKNKDY